MGIERRGLRRWLYIERGGDGVSSRSRGQRRTCWMRGAAAGVAGKSIGGGGGTVWAVESAPIRFAPRRAGGRCFLVGGWVPGTFEIWKRWKWWRISSHFLFFCRRRAMKRPCGELSLEVKLTHSLLTKIWITLKFRHWASVDVGMIYIAYRIISLQC